MKEDHEIIELYWARSESAVHETDEKYGAKLHTLSGRILPEAEDAEECVNDTYLGAWNAMPPHRPSRALCVSGAHLPQHRVR